MRPCRKDSPWDSLSIRLGVAGEGWQGRRVLQVSNSEYTVPLREVHRPRGKVDVGQQEKQNKEVGFRQFESGFKNEPR